MKKAKHQEQLLDEYFKQKGITVIDTVHQDSLEANIARHKAHERLGFGYLAMFRTMRFLFVLMLVMSVMMLSNGLMNYFSKTDESPLGYNIFDELSIANAYYSMPVCVQ